MSPALLQSRSTVSIWVGLIALINSSNTIAHKEEEAGGSAVFLHLINIAWTNAYIIHLELVGIRNEQ